jgi:hypothetical protein
MVGSIAVAALLVACGSPDPTDTGDPHVTSSSALGAGAASASPGAPASADTDAGVPPPSDLGGASEACATDRDCTGGDALCVEHVCHQACHDSHQCGTGGTGGTCQLDNGHGGCFNAPGCNPPPPGQMCPTTCWGFCEYDDGG